MVMLIYLHSNMQPADRRLAAVLLITGGSLTMFGIASKFNANATKVIANARKHIANASRFTANASRSAANASRFTANANRFVAYASRLIAIAQLASYLIASKCNCNPLQ